MLSDDQIISLSSKMSVPLERCCYKSQLEDEPLEYNRSYVVNFDDEIDECGGLNAGSHWVCFQVNKHPNGKIEGCYFDPYGLGPPKTIAKYMGEKIPHTTKDIQGVLGNVCGFFCLAFLHFVNAFANRSRDLHSDAEHFLDFFLDINKRDDNAKQNEYILKQFFRTPNDKTPVEVDFKNFTNG
jgi:hypothetical protein